MRSNEKRILALEGAAIREAAGALEGVDPVFADRMENKRRGHEEMLAEYMRAFRDRAAERTPEQHARYIEDVSSYVVKVSHEPAA